MAIDNTIVDIRQLDAIRFKFTELGKTLQEVSTYNSKLADDLGVTLSEGLGKISEQAVSSEDFRKAARSAGMGDAYINSMSGEFKKVSSAVGVSMKGADKAVESANAQFRRLSDESRSLLEKQRIKAMEDGKGKGSIPGSSSLKGYAKGEVGALKNKIGGMLGKLQLPKWGAIGAGLIGIMAYGYHDAKRVQAEAGEIENILISSYRSTVSGVVSSGTAKLSHMQEYLQKHLGINKKGVQDVAQAFVDGGVSVDTMLKKTGEEIEHVESSAHSVTFALDKMFEIADGSSAKRMVSLMTDYGKSVEDAQSSLVRFYMVGKQSGIGTMQFVKNVETASKSLVGMGIDIDNVVDIYNNVTESFAKMGVPKQFAGRIAAEGIQNIASGMTSMEMGWQIVIAERLYSKQGLTDLDARQMLLDGFAKVSGKDRVNEFLKVIEIAADLAMNATGDNVNEARYLIENGMGWKFEGARVALEVRELIKQGKMVEAAKATEENMEILSKSLSLESKKANKFDLMLNVFLKGLAKLGQGLLGMAVRGIALMIAYVKALPAILANLITGNDKGNTAIRNEIMKIVGNGEEDRATALKGIRQMAATAKKMGSDILGDSITALADAYSFNPAKAAMVDNSVSLDPSGNPINPYQSQGATGGGAVGASQVSGKEDQAIRDLLKETASSGSSGPNGAAPQSYASDQMYGGIGSRSPRIKPTRPEGLGGGTPPGSSPGSGGAGGGGKSGGGLVVSSKGINRDGDISIGISGNCPGCGYDFGSGQAEAIGNSPVVGGYSKLDLVAFARMLETETIHRPQGKEAVAIGWTALNRLSSGKYGDTMYDVITGSERKGKDLGFGEQGGARPYASKSQASKKALKLARELLEGKHEDPTHGARWFQHLYADSQFARTIEGMDHKNRTITTATPRRTGDGKRGTFVTYSGERGAPSAVADKGAFMDFWAKNYQAYKESPQYEIDQAKLREKRKANQRKKRR